MRQISEYLVDTAGWEVMTAADFSTHKAEFIKQYNANKGIAPVKLFKSGNCCFAVKGGDKLTITGSKCLRVPHRPYSRHVFV